MQVKVFMKNDVVATLQTKAKEYIKAGQYDKVLALNEIIKDLELNPNVFLEGEWLNLC